MHAAAASLLAEDEIAVDARARVSGRLRYTADVRRPRMLWAAFAISPHAHARIVEIDTAAARAVDGVRAVLTAADIGRRLTGRQLMDWPVLAWDRVRMIGDRVAAVAAETREAAERAARLVAVRYSELPVLTDPRAALAPDAPVLHPERDTYFHAAFAGKDPMAVAHPNVQGFSLYARGAADLDVLFASAYRTFAHTFISPRVHSGYIEPRATLVWVDDDDTVHVQSPNKTPYGLRGQLARALELPAEKIVIEAAAIGGDFGGKGFTNDEAACYYLARATGRPVRYVESYTEELTVGGARHRSFMTLTSAVDERGARGAHPTDLLYEGGAYAAPKGGPRVFPRAGYAGIT
jgi:CO/xanthine dehydrogenase Mo-binding subunit